MILAEELLLLSIESKTGAIRNLNLVKAGLAAGILMDLEFVGAIQVADGVLRTDDEVPIKDEIPLHARKIISAADFSGDAREWTTQLANRFKNLSESVINRLVKNRLVDIQEKRTLGLMPRVRYPIVNDDQQAGVRGRIRAAIIAGSPPDRRTTALIRLLRACDLLETILTADELKANGKRLNQILTDQTRPDLYGADPKLLADAVAAAASAI